MNRIKNYGLLGALGLTLVMAAQAQERPFERPAGLPDGPPPFAQLLPEGFAKLAAFDVNGDKTLDVDELAMLATAVADGSLQRPDWLPEPPIEVEIPVEKIVLKVGELYEALAPYDLNNNGFLEEEDRMAIRDAIVSGKLKHPIMIMREAIIERFGEERPRGRRPRFGRFR